MLPTSLSSKGLVLLSLRPQKGQWLFLLITPRHFSWANWYPMVTGRINGLSQGSVMVSRGVMQSCLDKPSFKAVSHENKSRPGHTGRSHLHCDKPGVASLKPREP